MMPERLAFNQKKKKNVSERPTLVIEHRGHGRGQTKEVYCQVSTLKVDHKSFCYLIFLVSLENTS